MVGLQKLNMFRPVLGSLMKRNRIKLAIIFIFISFALLGENPAEGLEKQLNKPDVSKIKEKIRLLAELSELSHDSEPLEAMKHGKEALESLRQFNDPSLEVRVLLSLTRASKNIGWYQTALEYGNKAEIVALESGDKRSAALVYNLISRIYHRLGFVDRSLNYALRALESFNEMEDSKNIAEAYKNIGNTYRTLNDNKKALESYQKSLYLLKKLGDKKSMAPVLIYIGDIYHSYRRYTKALEYYQESQNIVEKQNWKMGQAGVLCSIASVYTDIGKPVLALDYCQKALRICKDMGQKRNIAILLGHMAKCHRKLGQYEKALSYVSEALEIAKKINNKDIIRHFYKEFYHIYVAMKSYEKSYPYYSKYKSTNDEIFSKEYRKSISELLSLKDKARISGEEILQSIQNNSIQKLKSERKVLARNLIILLSLLVLVLVFAGVYYLYYRYQIKRKAERLLKESERKLRAMNSAKDKLFSIIAHDLESPLNGLLLSSGYLGKNYNTMKEKEIKEFIHQIYENTYNISTLLDNLLQWAVSQLGKLEVDPEILDLSRLTGDTIALMEPSAREKNIRLMSHINENTLAWADKRMVETVMRNLVSNAVKYSTKGGEVHISSKSNSNFLEVAVSDTGVGIPANKLDTLFALGIHNSTRGTADESGLGLGLVLCKEFVEKNGGTIRVENNSRNKTSTGTRVVFTLPTHPDSRREENRKHKPGIDETLNE